MICMAYYENQVTIIIGTFMSWPVDHLLVSARENIQIHNMSEITTIEIDHKIHHVFSPLIHLVFLALFCCVTQISYNQYFGLNPTTFIFGHIKEHEV